MGERYLILNADDYGLCKPTNMAIEELFEGGFINSASLMAPCPMATEAALYSSRNNVDVGVHVTINSEIENWRFGSLSHKDSLKDDNGYFYMNAQEASKFAVSDDVFCEIEKQYSFLAEAAKVSKMDSHCGTLYGLTGNSFLPQAFSLCAKYKLPFRLPKNTGYLKDSFGENIPRQILEIHAKAVEVAQAMGIHLLDDMFTNEQSVKRINGYDGLKEFYMNVLKRLNEGITEIFMHPSYPWPEVMNNNIEWEKRVWEFNLLKDEDFRNLIDKEGIKLVSWGNVHWK